MQIRPDGSVGLLNILDGDFMPYTSINGTIIPAVDATLVSSAPAPGSAGYGQAIIDFIKGHSPDTWNGIGTNFLKTFLKAVTFDEAFPDGRGDVALLPTMSLEVWGVTTSAPAYDPGNDKFVYMRYQREVMHHDRNTGLTQGLLLADYFKSIITGVAIPFDLQVNAANSRFYLQYDKTKPGSLRRADLLPATDMTNAFEKETDGTPTPTPTPPSVSPTPTRTPTAVVPTSLRYGMQAHMFYLDRGRVVSMVRGAGFDWIKQQIRWEDMEGSEGAISWGEMDGIVAAAQAQGAKLLFSVVTTPGWARADGRHDGPPDDYNKLASFLGALATRYKDKVGAYEVWNEQNLAREWSGGAINAGRYIELLKLAYSRIKQADPNALVIAGALTPTGVNDPNLAVDDAVYLEQMYQYESGVFKQYADAVGVHMAGYNNAPDDWVDRDTVNTPGFKGHGSFYFKRIDQLHDVIARYGDTRQVWITEYEWAAADNPVPAGYEWTSHLNEAQVAAFYVRGFEMIKAERPWVGAVFVWNLNWRTFANYHTNEGALFGILNEDWSPRAIYNALKNMPK